MKTSIQHSVLGKNVSLEENLKSIAMAGFEAVDLSVTGNVITWEDGIFTDPFNSEFVDYFKKVAATVAENGLELYQTHAPYCRPFQCDANSYATVLRQTIRAVYATAYMNCKYIVAHPIIHPDFNRDNNREQGIQANLKYFSALVPVLKETGVIMCIENLYWGEVGQAKVSNACSGADQLIEVIDTLNATHGPYFAACLDTGHAVAAGHDPVEMLRLLGKRIRSLHLHDSWGLLDDHLFPATAGNLDWNDFCKVLGEIGYDGAFNFEVIFYPQNSFIKADSYEAYCAATLKMLSDVAHSMVELAEKDK